MPAYAHTLSVFLVLFYFAPCEKSIHAKAQKKTKTQKKQFDILSGRFYESTADVVIIGGGIVGASVAFHLAERGCSDVLVVEREAEQGLGSTGKATGGVRAQFATAINIRMSRYSIDFFTRFEETTGHACGYEPAGYLFVATSEAQFDYLKRTRARQAAEGLTNVELVGADEIARRVPGLRTDDVAGGSFCGTDGSSRRSK